MDNINEVRLLKGSVKSIQFWSRVLAYGLGAKLCKECPAEQAFRTISYTIPIPGNPSNPKEVTMWVRLDNRNGKDSYTSEICIEHGIEFLEWAMTIGSLCDCCIYNRGKYHYVCFAWEDPYTGKRFCPSYKFSEMRLKQYLERVSEK